jgi:hypothetical protein
MTPPNKAEEDPPVWAEDVAQAKTPDRERPYERRYNMLLSAIPFSVLMSNRHLRVRQASLGDDRQYH